MLTLIAIESVDYRQLITNSSCQLFGSIKPIAIIVCTPDETYALDMEARPANLDQLRQVLPELDAIIAPVSEAKKRAE